MTPNELAEILENDSKHTSGRFTYSSRYIADIATMLRQQQAEIEDLKAKKLALSYVDLEARLDWSRHEGSGASYLEGFEHGSLWAEQEIRKASEK